MDNQFSISFLLFPHCLLHLKFSIPSLTAMALRERVCQSLNAPSDATDEQLLGAAKAKAQFWLTTRLRFRRQLCKRCRRLDFRRIFWPENDADNLYELYHRTWDVRWLQDYSSRCKFCHLLLALLQQAHDPRMLSEGVCSIIYWEDYQTIRTMFIDWAIDIDSFPDSTPVDGIRTIGLTGYRGHSPPLNQGCIVDPYRVDLRKIRGWLDACQEHGFPCISLTMSFPIPFPFFLIDVRSKTIVEQHRPASYFALSYVWGGVPQLQLESKTKHLLCNPAHGLSDSVAEEFGTCIPQTIKDAIELCVMLDEHYLWVDSLCIEQDNTSNKSASIANMDQIYRSATATIVAASGNDANAGLPGVRPYTRNDNSTVEHIDGIKLGTCQPDYNKDVHKLGWDLRAWTCQEKILSTRLLIFTQNQVLFECKTVRWSEDRVYSVEQDSINVPDVINNHYATMTVKWSSDNYRSPAFFRYDRLRADYSARYLTYEIDALKAFTGIMKALGHSFGDNWFWGHPETDFSEALLWGNFDGCSLRQRRPDFPSWSWLGWHYQTNSLAVDPIPVIKFFRLDNMGRPVLIGRDDENLGAMRELEQLASQDMAVQPEKQEQNPRHRKSKWVGSQLLPPPLDLVEYQANPDRRPLEHLLRFFTSVAKLNVSDDQGNPKIEGCRKTPHDVSLDRTWRKAQPHQLDFILVGVVWTFRWGVTDVHLLVVEFIDGIAYRRGQCANVDEEVWDAANPKWELVTMA